MIKEWCWEHSLSIATGVGFVLANIAFFMVDAGHLYDFFNMIAGCFGGGFVMVILARKYWEKGSDPAKPPEDE